MRVSIETKDAPAAIGPYVQAVRQGPLLFCSGQIPLHPDTGELVSGGVREQTAQVLRNLQAVLGAAGVDVSAVVKTTVFLTDLSTFSEMNEEYGRVFQHHRPARSTIQVAALPKGAQVEIEAVAWVEPK